MEKQDKKTIYRFPEFASPEDKTRKTGGQASTVKKSREEMIQAAETEGYQAGYRNGRDQTKAEEEQRFRPLGVMLGKSEKIFGSHQSKLGITIEEDTRKIAMALARDLVRNEIHRRPELVTHVVRKALQKVRGQEQLKIKTHPGDCERVRALLRELIPDAEAADSIMVSSDHSIQKGGCMIETEFGVIDARIDQQLAAIEKTFETPGVFADQSARPQESEPPRLNDMLSKVENGATIKTYGHVSKVVGLVVEANGPAVQMGCICDLYGDDDQKPIAAEVLGFRDRTVLMMPLEEIRSIGPGSKVVARQEKASVAVGGKLLGRVIDGLCNPIDNRGPLQTETHYPIYAQPINPLLRQRIRTPLDMGVRSINGLLTVGCGQRMGIFAGSGVGKSVLMGMIARKCRADVNVIALIGERGRELNEFIDKDLGEEGLKKSVVVVATSDHLPLVRVRGAFVATAIAEYFRDQGLHVNLMMDSLTRFAMAQREIGLALGEPPTTKGYTPSVFTLLPKLLERAGTSDHSGSITGLYTVLVEGDDMNEPIADAARSILDGHIVLSRDLANQNHYPAIDVLRSISRVMEDIASLQHKHASKRLKELLATYRKAEDLINIGAYVAGSNQAIDRAMEKIELINAYLRQGIDESVAFEESLQQLQQIMN